MENNQQGVQVNPNYVIDELISKNAELTMENAKLKALLRQQAEQENTKEAE
ncbi:hypothetical protein [Staphylococcus simulans]|uniref:hypothetical protein n=1 Tax=Staphylococcus simulans TaxID=1286 RepID=UPI003F7E85CE